MRTLKRKCRETQKRLQLELEECLVEKVIYKKMLYLYCNSVIVNLTLLLINFGYYVH
jgi:hypothetical protein